MATLANKAIKDTYTSLLKLEGDTGSTVAGASGNGVQVKTGDNDATPLYLNTDRVGIGASPSELLHVEGSVDRIAVFKSTDNLSYLQISDDGDDFYVGVSDDNDVGFIGFNNSAHARNLNILSGGNVGIGTITPAARVHISSGDSGDCTVIIEADDDDSAENDVPKLILRRDENGGNGIFGYNGDAGTEYTGALQNSLYLQNWDNSATQSDIQFVTGGDKDAVTPGIARMTITDDGNVGIGTNAPAALLELDQGSSDDLILKFVSSDVAQPFTATAEADCYGSFGKVQADSGGLTIVGLKDSGGDAAFALYLRGLLGEACDTTHNTAGIGIITMDAAITNGSTGPAAATADGNLLTVRNNGSTRFIVDEDGDIFYDGASAAYDYYDDAHLIRALDTYKSPDNIIQTKFDDFLKYKRSALEDAGIMYKNTPEEEERGDKPFVCITKLQKLHNGAIWQQYTELEKMKELMYDAMVELMGKDKADKKLDSHNISLLDKDLLN